MISNNNINKIVQIIKLGNIDSFKINEIEIPKPKDNQVLVKIDYVALNRADIYFASGHYLPIDKFPNPSGFEASGIIVELSDQLINDSNNQFKVGDKVSVVYAMDHTKYGTFAQYALFPVETLVKTNQLVNQKDAAATWISYLTAYYSIVENAKIKKGDYIVITAASSATALAAINIAKLIGAITIVTSRSNKKKQQLLDFGADHFIALDTEDYVARVLEITNGKGADVIFDAISGPFTSKLIDSIKQSGYLVIYGFMLGQDAQIPISSIRKHLTIKVFNCNEYVYQPEYFNKGVQYINNNLHHYKSIIGKEFIGIESINESLEYLQNNDLFGKVIIKINKNQ